MPAPADGPAPHRTPASRTGPPVRESGGAVRWGMNRTGPAGVTLGVVRFAAASAADRLARIVCTLFREGESFAALTGTAAVALALTTPACLALFGPIAVAVLGFHSISAFRDWADGKTLADFIARMNDHADGLAAAGRFVAEREGLSVPVPAHDPRHGPLAFYTFLRGEFLNAELRDRDVADRLATLLDEHRGLAADIADAIVATRREVDFVRDDLLDLAADARRRHGELLTKLDSLADAHAPSLTVPPDAPVAATRRGVASAAGRFLYRRELVPVFGRDAERAALLDFLGTERTLGWWVLTGPGGAGKSRLAWDLCRDARRAGWRAGFLRRETPCTGWPGWTPRCPTLIVIDYAVGRADTIAAALTVLHDRLADLRAGDPESPPVRVLLLERAADEQVGWYAEHFARQADTTAATLADTRHAAPREVGPLGDDALWAVLSHVWDDLGFPPPDRDAALATLRTIDPAGRPLFAAFYAEAVAGGFGADRSWDPRTLTEAILEREAKAWRAEAKADPTAGFDPAHANLLALATMCGRITGDDLDTLAADRPVPALDEYRPAALARMNGFAGAGDPDDPRGEDAAPFEPDFLGECFVLGRLAGEEVLKLDGRSRTARRKDAAKLVAWGWANRPAAMIAFCRRAFCDFPMPPADGRGEPTALRRLVAPPADGSGRHACLVATAQGVDEVDRGCGAAASDGWLCHLDREHAPAGTRAMARVNRGLMRYHAGDRNAAAADYTAVINGDDAPAGLRAMARVSRGLARDKAGDRDGAEADFTAVIDGDDAPADAWASARVSRGLVRYQAGDRDGAAADFTAVLVGDDTPDEVRVLAYFARYELLYGGRPPEGEAVWRDFPAARGLLPEARRVGDRDLLGRCEADARDALRAIGDDPDDLDGDGAGGDAGGR